MVESLALFAINPVLRFLDSFSYSILEMGIHFIPFALQLYDLLFNIPSFNYFDCHPQVGCDFRHQEYKKEHLTTWKYANVLSNTHMQCNPLEGLQTVRLEIYMLHNLIEEECCGHWSYWRAKDSEREKCTTKLEWRPILSLITNESLCEVSSLTIFFTKILSNPPLNESGSYRFFLFCPFLSTTFTAIHFFNHFLFVG